MVKGLFTCKVHRWDGWVPGLKYPQAYPAFLLLTSPSDLLPTPHTRVLKQHLCTLSFCRSEVQAQHDWYQQGLLSHSGLGPLSNALGTGKPHCLVDEKLRSPFPPLLTARDYSQLLESPSSSWPQGSMGSSHMDVYFLPHWLELLCFPLLQLVEKTVFKGLA